MPTLIYLVAMTIVEFEIPKWEKYNPKHDTSKNNNSWFQLSNHLMNDSMVMTLDHKTFRVFMMLLCERSQQKREKCSINVTMATRILSIGEKKILQAIVTLNDAGFTRADIRIEENRREKKKRYEHKTEKPKATKSDENTQARPSFELAIFDAYKSYPRKEGKSLGVKSLLKQINNLDDVNLLNRAIKNYTAVAGTDVKFIKQFSTFANCWRDYTETQSTVNKFEIKMGLIEV